MRIALTNPTNWPYVRRGVERFCNDLAGYLARRGHRVTLVCAKPGRRERFDTTYTTVLHRRLWHPALGRMGILEFHPFGVTALGHLLRGSYDVVMSCTFMDAYAACLARHVTDVPCVFWVNGLTHRIRYVRSVSLRGAVFGRAVRAADEVIALSNYMQQDLQRRFGRCGTRIPVPVDVDTFRVCRQRDHERPIILCAAALDDERKGGRFLMKAFNRLKEKCPRAILRLSCTMGRETRSALLACLSPRWTQDVEFLGPGRLADVPGIFGSAAISVLPSRWEPFGLVLIESLATGTPVVATRDGAIPEVVDDPRVSRLFDPGSEGTVEPNNVDGFVQAMLEALELSRERDTVDRCRAHAEQFGWDAIGPRFAELLETVARRGPAVAAVRQAL